MTTADFKRLAEAIKADDQDAALEILGEIAGVLVGGVIKDIHRIADALERIADSQSQAHNQP